MATNKNTIENKLQELGYIIGCYDNKMDKLPKKELTKVFEQVEYGDGDVEVKIARKAHIVEVFIVGNEVDFKAITPTAYEKQYGRKVRE